MSPTRLARVPLLAAGFLSTVSGTHAQEPAVGSTRTTPVATVSLTVGSTEKDSKRVVYAPPPGWYVRSHRVVCGKKFGAVTYAVSTVPAGWNFVTDERSAASAKSNGSVRVAYHALSVAEGTGNAGQQATATGRQTNTASHHALVVDVSAKGAGLLQGGAGVELTVIAELVYLGKDAAQPVAVAAVHTPAP